MARKNTLKKKEKTYVVAGAALILIILIIIGIIAFNNLFSGNNKNNNKIDMNLKNEKITSGDETQLKLTIKNTGDELLEGTILVTANDEDAINITHRDPSSLTVKLYPEESITKVLTVKGTTNAIRTDYKIIAKIINKNETISESETIITVTNEEL